MTKFEELLLFFDDYLKSIKVDYMLFASTLLGVVRGGRLIDRDMEIDVAMLGKDITPELLDKFGSEGLLKNTFQKALGNCEEKYGLIYLTSEARMFRDKGWMAISPMWLKGETCYSTIVGGDCMVLPKDVYYKKNWSTIKYLGRKFNVPPDPEKFLESFYGKDWKTPKNDWHWRNNENYKQWSELGFQNTLKAREKQNV